MKSIRLHNSSFDAYIYEFTSNTYIMVIISDPDVSTLQKKTKKASVPSQATVKTY